MRWGAVVAGLVLVGCGAPAEDGGAPADVVTSAEIDWAGGAEMPEGWAAQALEVTAMRLNGDRTLEVEAGWFPVELDDGSCVGEVGGVAQDEVHPEVVWIQVLSAGPNMYADGATSCPEETATVEVELPVAIEDRGVRVNNFDLWVPDDGGAYSLCELPGCDPDTGGAPATASCDDEAALVEDIRTTGDVGQHADIGERRCQDGWAMVEVDIGAGACPPSDGAENPCAGERIDRLFLRAGTPRWEVVTRTRDAGCGDVVEVEPDFPVALCEDRPALGG